MDWIRTNGRYLKDSSAGGVCKLKVSTRGNIFDKLLEKVIGIFQAALS